MKKIGLVIVLTASIILQGCKYAGGAADMVESHYAFACIDGVEYIIYTPALGKVDAMSPHFKTDGTLYLCNSEGK